MKIELYAVEISIFLLKLITSKTHEDLNKSDTISPGKDSGVNIVMITYIGKDTLRIYGDNYLTFITA